MSGKRLRNLAKLVFGIGVLIWIASRLELDKLIELARHGDGKYFALGVGFLVTAMIGLQWSRLHVLIRSYTPNLRVSLEIFFVGALFNNFLPSNIGGDAVRLMYLKRLRSDNWGTPFVLLLLYRAVSFGMLIAAGAVYIAFSHERLFALLRAHGLWVQPRAGMWLAAAAAVCVLVAVGFLLRRRISNRLTQRIGGFLRNCGAGLRQLRPRDVASLLLQTFVFHLCRAFAFYFLVRYMGQPVAFWDLVFVISATAVIAVLPVTVAGLGVLEASITGLLAIYGVDTSSAAAVALVNRAVLLLAASIGGLVYLRSDSVRSAAQGLAKSSATPV